VSNSIVLFGDISNYCIHTWHHIYYLFGFSICGVLEFVVIFKISSSSSKSDFE
jgi:hypothetical protein